MKVREAYDLIPLEKRKWEEDGKYHEIKYNEEYDIIEDEITLKSGDWYDTIDVTDDWAY